MFVFACPPALYNLDPGSRNSQNLLPSSWWTCQLRTRTPDKRKEWLLSCILFCSLASMVPACHNYSSTKPNLYISLQRRHPISVGGRGLASGIGRLDRICTETILQHLAVWIEEIGRHELHPHPWISSTNRTPIQAVRIPRQLILTDNTGQTFA